VIACQVRHVSKRFDGVAVLVDVSFDIPEGGAVALVGPSGCGKTTVLRLVAGLETPDTGEVWLNDERVTAEGRSIVPPYRRGIGFVPQDLALWPHMSVTRHLEFILGSRGASKRSYRSTIADTLRLARIERLAARYPHQLSGGEQQRLALARALVVKPRLLLLDEPFSSLDPELREALQQEVVQLRRQLNVPLLAVTHDRHEAAVLADTVIAMRPPARTFPDVVEGRS
jgi:ABC-type Fe3+/spermidine/putrescine transport system ATPase subunit